MDYAGMDVGGLIRALNHLEWQDTQRARQALESHLLQTGLYRLRADGRASVWAVPKSERPVCGARTRAHGHCKAWAVPGRRRCRMHGGTSTGPKSDAGRARIAQSNRRRAEERRQDAQVDKAVDRYLDAQVDADSLVDKVVDTVNAPGSDNA